MIRLGQLLYRNRTKRKLSLEDAAKATKIKASFLSAIEKGEYHRLPSPAYAKGFVINYAVFLGLTKTEAVALFKREFDEKRIYKVLPDSLARKQNIPLFRIKIKESFLAMISLLIIFLGFLLFQYRFAFFAPPLTVSSPKEGAVLSKEITVIGETDSNATVTVNNEPVSLNSDGKFSKRLELFPGEIEIIVIARSRFGKETVIKREIVVK